MSTGFRDYDTESDGGEEEGMVVVKPSTAVNPDMPALKKTSVVHAPPRGALEHGIPPNPPHGMPEFSKSFASLLAMDHSDLDMVFAPPNRLADDLMLTSLKSTVDLITPDFVALLKKAQLECTLTLQQHGFSDAHNVWRGMKSDTFKTLAFRIKTEFEVRDMACTPLIHALHSHWNCIIRHYVNNNFYNCILFWAMRVVMTILNSALPSNLQHAELYIGFLHWHGSYLFAAQPKSVDKRNIRSGLGNVSKYPNEFGFGLLFSQFQTVELPPTVVVYDHPVLKHFLQESCSNEIKSILAGLQCKAVEVAAACCYPNSDKVLTPLQISAFQHMCDAATSLCALHKVEISSKTAESNCEAPLCDLRFDQLWPRALQGGRVGPHTVRMRTACQHQSLEGAHALAL